MSQLAFVYGNLESAISKSDVVVCLCLLLTFIPYMESLSAIFFLLCRFKRSGYLTQYCLTPFSITMLDVWTRLVVSSLSFVVTLAEKDLQEVSWSHFDRNENIKTNVCETAFSFSWLSMTTCSLS